MKKSLCALLVLALVFVCQTAFAQSLDRAMPAFDLTPLEKYGSYTLDESTGDWSVTSNEASALLRAAADGALSGNADSVFFYLRLEGNTHTGALLPVLCFVRMGTGSENARAVSLFADDARYDIAVTREEIQLGNYRAEQMRALLSESDLAMLDAVRAAKDVRVFLHGDDGYLTTLRLTGSYRNARERVEAASVRCLSMADELRAMHFPSYEMSDADKARWELATDVTPRIDMTDLVSETIPTGDDIPELGETTHMLTTRNSGAEVTLLQKKLISLGYQFTTASSAYGERTRAAVLDLQKFYGLMETGSVDARLLSCLYENASPAPAAAQTPDAESVAVDDVSLALTRYWFARKVLTSRPADDLSSYESENGDNLLIVADGTLSSLSASEISLGWDMKAQFVYDGQYAYDAEIRCERDEGSRFDNVLTALGSSRVVIAAEVPARLAAAEGAWTLVVTRNDAAAEYSLS